MQITMEEAQSHLPDLIAAAVKGEEVYIINGEKQWFQLVPIGGEQKQVIVRQIKPANGIPDNSKGETLAGEDFDQIKAEQPTKPKQRVLDDLKGQIIIADDFDEPLEDFKDYM